MHVSLPSFFERAFLWHLPEEGYNAPFHQTQISYCIGFVRHVRIILGGAIPSISRGERVWVVQRLLSFKRFKDGHTQQDTSSAPGAQRRETCRSFHRGRCWGLAPVRCICCKHLDVFIY